MIPPKMNGNLFTASVRRFIPEFYLAASLDFLRMCIYSMTRSLVTRCVADNEIGKCFSAIAVFSSLVPLVSSPAFRCS